MSEFHNCEHCFHFVQTGMDGECHLEGPKMPGLHGTSRWPAAGRAESCGQWVANLDWFVRQIEESREAVAALIGEKEELELQVEGLKGEIEQVTEWLAKARRKPLPVAGEQEGER